MCTLVGEEKGQEKENKGEEVDDGEEGGDRWKWTGFYSVLLGDWTENSHGVQRMGDGSGPEIKSIAHGSWDQESRL